MASRVTRDHEEIQRWAAERSACPAVVSRTGGMLRFEFDPQHASELSQVDWDDFFQVFDEKGLELVYDDKPGSRFHKLVYPETVEAKAEHRPSSQPARAAKRMQIVPRSGEEAGTEAGATAGAAAPGRPRRARAQAGRRAPVQRARPSGRQPSKRRTAAGTRSRTRPGAGRATRRQTKAKGTKTSSPGRRPRPKKAA